MKNSMRLLPVLCILSFALCGSEVYKWVDEDGNVHYSDKPPENQQSTEVEIQKAPAVSEENVAESSAETWLEQQRTKREEEKQQKKDLRQITAADSKNQCSAARHMLSILEIQCPVFYDSQGVLRVHCPYQSVTASEGESRYIEDDIRSGMLDRYRDQLKSCGNAGR